MLALDELRARASARQDNMDPATLSYGVTSEDMNLVGLLGEDAVLRWLTEQGAEVQSIADDPTSIATGQGDLQLSFSPTGWTRIVAHVEVKTSRRRDYARFERTVVSSQLSRMACDAVFWCTAEDDLADRGIVDIMGWLPCADAQAPEYHEPAEARGRPAVRIKRPLRDPSEFMSWLDSEARKRPPF
ncbi:hypothetical protein ACFP8W_00775 [Nocardioides hankookensis]|uniref:DUF4365 domain-containing protein n=1 Tax=Nocardioides hankookensis TaxID=443157 RepID=A0ABW1LMS6_9ACTN